MLYYKTPYTMETYLETFMLTRTNQCPSSQTLSSCETQPHDTSHEHCDCRQRGRSVSAPVPITAARKMQAEEGEVQSQLAMARSLPIASFTIMAIDPAPDAEDNRSSSSSPAQPSEHSHDSQEPEQSQHSQQSPVSAGGLSADSDAWNVPTPNSDRGPAFYHQFAYIDQLVSQRNREVRARVNRIRAGRARGEVDKRSVWSGVYEEAARAARRDRNSGR